MSKVARALSTGLLTLSCNALRQDLAWSRADLLSLLLATAHSRPAHAAELLAAADSFARAGAGPFSEHTLRCQRRAEAMAASWAADAADRLIDLAAGGLLAAGGGLPAGGVSMEPVGAEEEAAEALWERLEATAGPADGGGPLVRAGCVAGHALEGREVAGFDVPRDPRAVQIRRGEGLRTGWTRARIVWRKMPLAGPG
jgi:hypothetical protein